jgi:hypothetical protein
MLRRASCRKPQAALIRGVSAMGCLLTVVVGESVRPTALASLKNQRQEPRLTVAQARLRRQSRVC